MNSRHLPLASKITVRKRYSFGYNQELRKLMMLDWALAHVALALVKCVVTQVQHSVQQRCSAG